MKQRFIKQRYFKMKNLNDIKSQIALEIMQLSKISFDWHQDNECTLLDHIESNGYCQPSEIGSTAEAYDLLWSDLSRKTDYETPDFSSCSSAFECIELEGQAILDAVYYEAKCEIVKELASVLDEVFSEDFGDYELNEMFIGKAGLGHIPHEYETDVGDTSLIVWNGKAVQVTVEGVTLHGILEKAED